MTNTETLQAARALFNEVTPLRSDCGLTCGAACCASLTGEETGMLLFPGEEAFYRDRPGFRIRAAAQGQLLICDGACSRDERPLSCRLFPLLPLNRPEGIRVGMDCRARAVCPLAAQSPRALDPAFVAAVRACGELLAASPAQRPFLSMLTAEQDALRDLIHQFKGD